MASLPLPWTFDPLEALRRWPAGRRVQFLHSGRFDPRWSRYSILAEPQGAFRFRATASGCVSEWLGDPALCPVRCWTHRPFRDLRSLFEHPGSLWIGHLGYDVGRYLERLPRLATTDREWPVIQLHCCTGWLVHDLPDGSWRAMGTWAETGPPDLDRCEPAGATFEAAEPVSNVSREAYEHAIHRARSYIAAGDAFQVNLSQRFTSAFHGYPRELFVQLAETSGAWYGAYLELLGDDDADTPRRIVASASPELFLRVEDAGRVTSRPIKGTRSAAVDPLDLWTSEKDTAELNMIVDLVRNDLGRVCSYGSVRVAEARQIETHPTVHHGVATVTGQLYTTKNLVDLLRATMPGGSVTGAPKIRAMQIIDELEPVRRGPYCGAIGYVHGARGDRTDRGKFGAPSADACFNIAIRTMLLELDAAGLGRVDFSVGGAIVADSDASAEYQETLDKSAALVRALRQDTAAPRPLEFIL